MARDFIYFVSCFVLIQRLQEICVCVCVCVCMYMHEGTCVHIYISCLYIIADIYVKKERKVIQII